MLHSHARTQARVTPAAVSSGIVLHAPSLCSCSPPPRGSKQGQLFKKCTLRLCVVGFGNASEWPRWWRAAPLLYFFAAARRTGGTRQRPAPAGRAFTICISYTCVLPSILTGMVARRDFAALPPPPLARSLARRRRPRSSQLAIKRTTQKPRQPMKKISVTHQQEGFCAARALKLW